MNNKRQTIWLVSMLSLMVVLSAYYLFTEDAGPAAPPVAERTQDFGLQAQGDEIVVHEVVEEGVDGDAGKSEDAAVGSDTDTSKANGEAADETGNPAQPEAGSEDTAVKEDTAVNETGKETAKSEDEILEEVAQVQAGSSSAKLESYQLDRANKNMQLHEELMAKLGDQNTTPEETAKVTNDLNSLEEKESILWSIEEKLQQQFENAVVKEENDRYNVVVLSEGLDAKNAAGIVSMVMKELNVSQDKISVQYVTP
ncbi:SpoIIIAH-like family protein [Paenibacillus algicola]|nr:SpoIIIAH-like family protein [Paenibacillus algicola]